MKNYFASNFLKFFLVLAISLQSHLVSAKEVLFAGVAFTGNANQRELLYPWAEKLAQEKNTENLSVLDLAVRDAMQDFSSESLQLKYDQAKDTRSGSTITLAFGLGGESMELVKFKSEVIAIYRIMTRIVVFDWASDQKKLIASFPLQIVYQDASTHAPTAEQQEQVFRRLYTDTGWDGNVFQSLKAKLQQTQIKEKYGLYMGVGKVELGAEAQTLMSQAGVDAQTYETSIAQTLESVLSYELGVGLVPYTTGEAIANTMALRFSDARVFNLRLPESDYSVNFMVKNFRHVERESSRVRQVFIAAYARPQVALNAGAQGTFYFDDDVKHINSLAFSAQENVDLDYWSAYQTALRTLMVRFAKATQQSDPKIVKALSPEKDLTTAFAQLKTIVEKCK